MDEKTAEVLLDRIRTEKQAAGWFDPMEWLNPPPTPSTPSANPEFDTLEQHMRANANKHLQSSAKNDILKAMLIAGGVGAGMRGISGLSRMFSQGQQPVPSRTVDMPVMYPRDKEEDEEKVANNSDATSKIGLNYYIPSMLLGAPLAAYGGWSGVDAILDKQRLKKTDAELDEAKEEYQRALLGAYKRGSDAGDPLSVLDEVFDGHYDKQAAGAGDGDLEVPPGIIENFFRNYAPNLPGTATGLAAAYAIPAGLGGYAVVDSIMKKRSKQALLEKAMKERARRQAMQQPAEIYAIPTPRDDEERR